MQERIKRFIEPNSLTKGDIHTLMRCGVDPREVGYRLSSGLMSKVFMWGPDRVIKIPRRSTLFLRENASEAQRNICALQRQLGCFFQPTEILPACDGSVDYCIVQSYLPGCGGLTPQDSKFTSDLATILSLNREYIEQVGMSLDFVGMRGWLNGQIGKPILTNVVRTNGDELRVIDYDLFPVTTKGHTMLQGISSAAYRGNREYLEKYFGLTM